MQHRRAFVCIVVAAALALTGCSVSPPPASGCVPRIMIQPGVAAPGDTITLTSDTVCGDPRPDGGWVVTAGHVGGEPDILRTTSDDDFDGSFTATVELPADFPQGEASAGIENWDYSFCSGSGSRSKGGSDRASGGDSGIARASGSGSCAAAIGGFLVEP